MKRKCPACNELAVEPVVMVDDAAIEWDANDTIWECQNCYAVLSLVIWDVYEDRIHAGFNCVSQEDIGCTVVLHLARNRDEAFDWVDTVKPGHKADTHLNLN